MEIEIKTWLADIIQAIKGSVSEDTIWSIVLRDLPKLKLEVNKLLEN